jgi:hypothetical protein
VGRAAAISHGPKIDQIWVIGLHCGSPPAALNLPAHALAVKLQPVGDLVDRFALGANRKPHQIKLGAAKWN